MSNAIGQNATDLAPSALPPERFPWEEVASTLIQSHYPINNRVRERCKVNLSGLKLMVAKAFIDQSGGTFSHKVKLPSFIWDGMLTPACIKAMEAKLAKFITMDNVHTFRKEYSVDLKHGVTEKVLVIGENKLTLQKQRLGLTIAIGDCNRRIKNAIKNGKLTDELEDKINERIRQLEFLEMQLATEETAQEPLNKIVSDVFANHQGEQ